MFTKDAAGLERRVTMKRAPPTGSRSHPSNGKWDDRNHIKWQERQEALSVLLKNAKFAGEGKK